MLLIIRIGMEDVLEFTDNTYKLKIVEMFEIGLLNKQKLYQLFFKCNKI